MAASFSSPNTSEYFSGVPREERYDPRGGIPADMVPSPLKPRSLGVSSSLERSLIDEELAEAQRNGEIVEEISFVAPMSCPSVVAAEQQRMQELVDLRQAAAESLTSWGPTREVDGRFDEVTITEQLDALLPAVQETEPDIVAAEALRENEVVQDYTDLKALLRRLQNNEALPYADAEELGKAVCDAVRKICATLASTRNKSAAAECLELANGIVSKIQDLFSITIPDSRLLHQRAVQLDGECGEFETRRAAQDWSTELARQENHIFSAVSELLGRIGLSLEDCERIFQTLSHYSVSPVKLDAGKFEKDLALISAAMHRLREREEAEARHHAQLQRSLRAQQDKYAKNLANSNAIVAKLTAHIQNLLGDLANAQLAAWRDEKRLRVAERASVLLDKKQSMNTALAAAAEENLGNLQRDVMAAAACLKTLDELNQSTASELRRQAKERMAKLVNERFVLAFDRMALIKRKYVQTTQAIFASEAAIQLLRQESEAIALKKVRFNAAKQIEGVAEAAREATEIAAKITAEEANLAALRSEVGQLRDAFETTFESIAAISNSPELTERLLPVRESWLDLLADLKDAEKSQLQRVELNNRLDASFLNH